ncbi:MAG TPA: hypothetical protein VGT24_00065 [Candidatus Acidoferrales bacterium]|nr:hypothetical protein [Candidatus Acidoferrales bacterium]
MPTKISANELIRVKELETLGILLDGEVLEKSQDAFRGLWLGQGPNIVGTTIFDTTSRGTGISIDLNICNDSCQMIRLSAARLDVPWCKQIHWLEDPFRSAPIKHYYSLPMPHCQTLDRDVVLNHRFGPKKWLFPKDWLDGFLLGIGEEPIPDKYYDRQLFEARLSIFDGRQNSYPLDVKFLVHRDPNHHQRLKADKETVAASLAVGRNFSRVSAQTESCIAEPVT